MAAQVLGGERAVRSIGLHERPIETVLVIEMQVAARADDQRVLENLHASLVPGGRLLLELMGREILARTFTPRDWSEVGIISCWPNARSSKNGPG
jgi:hypothetical protein